MKIKKIEKEEKYESEKKNGERKKEKRRDREVGKVKREPHMREFHILVG